MSPYVTPAVTAPEVTAPEVTAPAAPQFAPARVARGRAGRLADGAVAALVAEAMLTPKPALVDQRGPGAHDDLDLERLLRSARALRVPFRAMALAAAGRRPDLALRETLGAIGRRGERRMLAATGGSNAHRGAIWVLGLLIAAVAMSQPCADGAELAQLAARLARMPDRRAPRLPSNGARVCRLFRVPGARGEAAAGLPHVIHVGLPQLRRARSCGHDETSARLDALLAIMASLDDTCLLHRGGRPALEAAQSGARRVLSLGGSGCAAGRRALLELDAELLRRRASPGGAADLLAACLFLDTIQAGAPQRRA
jgi:triphosphoribosyl-dephospho-CoA synthase